MSQPLPPNDQNASDGGRGNDDGDGRLSDLIVRYLNDMLTEDEAQLLGRQLDGNAERQAMFVRLARLHGLMSEWGRLMSAERGSKMWNLLDDAEEGKVSAGPPGMSLHDALVQPALNEWDIADPEESAVIKEPPVAERLPMNRPSRRGRWWIAAVAAAAMVAVIISLIPSAHHDTASTAVPPRTSQPVVVVPPPLPVPVPAPAIITASAAAAIGNVPLSRPGTTLSVGQTVDLTAGAIEITFDSGAIVAITAPSRLRILDRNHMALETGSLAAHVPPSGIGFRVDGADMTVIDQGTDFGMRPHGHGEGTELAVFKGAVDAMAAVASGPTTAPVAPKPIRVTGGNAVARASGNGAALEPTKYSPEAFVHSIEEYRVAIALRGTCAEVPFKSPDPNWTLVADPSGSFDKPRPVYAIEMRPAFFFAASPVSKWVSTEPKESNTSPGRFTFRTTVVLPDFAPGSASVTASWGADDQLADVVVNGVSTAKANEDMLGRVSRTQPTIWALRGATWHPGNNQVDVIVQNKPTPKGVLNQMALNVSWTAMLAPVVHRSGDAGTGAEKQAVPATSPTGGERG